jgi:hypothetical protein
MTDTIDVFLGEMRCALHRFQPKPGDVFILTVPGELSAEHAKLIEAGWKRNFPDSDLKLCILAGGATVELAPAAQLTTQ